MKSVKLYIAWIIIAFIGLSGCKDDALVEGNVGQVEEGTPVTVSVNFFTTPQKTLSRAEQTPETEYNVSTIYLFAFNARGEKTGGQAFTVNGTEATGSYANESFTGTINRFNVLTGTRQRLYAIANYNSSDFNLTKRQLDAIETEAELLDLSIATRGSRILLNHLSFVMEGVEENVTVSVSNGQGQITSSDGGEVDIELKRLNAKITFDVTANVTEAIDGTLKFVPKSYMVMNVPLNASITNRETNLSDAAYASMDEESEEEDKTPITLFDEVADTECSFTFYMLENYSAPPEKGETGSEGSGLWIDAEEKDIEENKNVRNLYALREKENKKPIPESGRDPNYPGKTEENTGYKYAPGTATYVVLKGELSYRRTNEDTHTEEYVNVSTEYTIHLGETGRANDADDETRVNNYTVARNVHYTYAIKLIGIDSYDAEVNRNAEVRPGVEGDVVIAGDQVRAIDSHYNRTRIKFTRQALQNGLSWIVQTPFDEGMKVADSDQNSLKDYKWVLFAVNKEFGVSSDDNRGRTMVKFPGYEAYDGGASTTGGVQTNANSDEGNSGTNCLQRGIWKNRISSANYYYNQRYYLSDDACLRDVNQLINHLREIANDDTRWNAIAEEDENGNEVVYVTAFIDEYVYIYNPENQEYTAPDANVEDPTRLILWKRVVNGRDRLLHICTEGAKYSSDGESSWSNSVLTIRQSPIYSIYNELDPTIRSAWGTESILETPALPIIPSGTNNTTQGIYSGMSFRMDNGRYNTLNFFGQITNNGGYTSSNIQWTDVLSRDADNIGTGDDQKDVELQTAYRDVWHACMTRNRDLDGDNVIDSEEVRWVLASIDELTDLWIGEDALPETAHLYQGDGTYIEHMVSSSGDLRYQEGESWDAGYYWVAPWIIWAEEGASRGLYNDGSYTDHETNQREYKYRCIRYLGIPLDNIDDVPEDYVTVTAGNAPTEYGTSYRIDLSKLDYSARRQSSDGGYELPLHYERGNDGNNRPYRAFEVLVTPQGYGNTARRWEYNNWEGGNTPIGFKDMVNFSNSSRLCPEGYRVPNQRELMLMYTSLNNSHTTVDGNSIQVVWSGSYWSATHYSFNGQGNRPGFATDASNMILTSTEWVWDSGNYVPRGDNISGKVRCVRDIVE